MASFITSSSVDPTYPTYPVVASIGIILILLPAYWHFKSGNVGTIIFIFWNFLGNLNHLVNSIAWAGNLHNPPWIWCDFSTALMVALNVAVPTSSLLISRRLYSIANIQRMNISRIDSRRAKYLEIALGIGLPILAVILRVVVQGHRFDIIENVGCWPSVYMTPVAIPLFSLPPILINLVSAYYSILSLRTFLNQRKQFSSVLQSANSGLTTGRYFRLMAVASTEIICAVPISTYFMVYNIRAGIQPWISWADTHFDFNRVEVVPFDYFQSYPETWVTINLNRYLFPVSSFLFFVYLGMSGESGTFYRRQFWRFARLLGSSDPSQATEASPEESWISRPGVRAPSRLRRLPPFVTSVSVTSTPKNKQLSLELNAYGTGSRSNSSSGSLSVPPDPKLEKESAHDSWLGIALSAEVHSSVV